MRRQTTRERYASLSDAKLMAAHKVNPSRDDRWPDEEARTMANEIMRRVRISLRIMSDQELEERVTAPKGGASTGA